MWALMGVFGVFAVTAIGLRLDSSLVGLAAGLFIVACLLLCAVMAVLDARQARATEAMIRTRFGKRPADALAARRWKE